MNIDLFTFLSSNSADYAEFLKYTCEKFISRKHKINWKCIESVGTDRIPDGYKLVNKVPNMHHNSMSHAVALNSAQNYIDSDYVIFIDADMAIVYKDWDEAIVNELNKYDCFGGSYGHKLKYRNFPTVYLFGFRSYILDKIKLDFSPKLESDKESPFRYNITDKTEARLLGKKIGDTIKCDTGWKIPLIIKEAGFSSNSMPMILMTSKKSQLPFENKEHKKICLQHPSHMCEWHYKNKLFATHKQASRNHPLNEGLGKAWKKRVELYIKDKLK